MKICRFQKHSYSKDFKQCPICKKAKMKAYRDANKEKINVRFREWYDVNKIKHQEHMKRYYQINKVKYKQHAKEWADKNREKFLLKCKEWYRNNKQRVMTSNRVRLDNRLKTNSFLRLRLNLSSLIRQSFRKNGYSKKSKTRQLIGCDFEFLLRHLVQSAIKNYGSFEFISDYHIDHIIPCASAKNEIELIKLQHYSNLQFLKPNDNISKSDKLDWTLPAVGIKNA